MIMTAREYRKWIDGLLPIVVPRGMETCQECGGKGSVECERAVVDWDNGGYLEGYMATCPECDGEGFTERTN